MPRAYDEVAPPLAADGCRVLVPYLRGYGPTRFLSADTPRSGEQAALGNDLLQFMDALGDRPRGARRATTGAAAPPASSPPCGPSGCAAWSAAPATTSRTSPRSAAPAPAEQEHRFWYQYYFHTERGRAGLTENRRDVCRLLWRLWSPTGRFDEATFEQSAASFDNPDFVDVVIQSYRHRYGYAPGDPALEASRRSSPRSRRSPCRPSPCMAATTASGRPRGPTATRRYFTGPYERRLIPRVGHNVPQEAPDRHGRGAPRPHERNDP